MNDIQEDKRSGRKSAEEQLFQMGLRVEKLEKTVSGLSSLIEEIRSNSKVKSTNELTPKQALEFKTKSFNNFGPINRDGKGNPLTQVDKDLADGKSIEIDTVRGKEIINVQ